MEWEGVLLERCLQCSSALIAPAGKRGDGAPVSQCSDCGLGFLNPMPTSGEIQGMYSRYYSRDDGIGYEAYGMDSFATSIDYVLLEVLKGLRHSKGDSVLDVGCAFGGRVAYFRKMGFIASVVDISAEAASLMIMTSYLATLASVIGAVISGMGRMWIGLGLNGIWASLFLLLVFVAVPTWGVVGLGVAYTLFYGVHLLLSLYVSHRRLAVNYGKAIRRILFFIMLIGLSIVTMALQGVLDFPWRIFLAVLVLPTAIWIGRNSYRLAYRHLLVAFHHLNES